MSPDPSILARQTAADQAISLLHRHYFDKFVHRSEELYQLTLVHPDHRTGDRIREINLDHIRKQVWNLMRSISSNYFGVIEFDVTVNEKSTSDPEKGGRDVAPHAHITFWTNKEIKPKVLSEKLSKRIGEHKDGIKSVVIKRCKGEEDDVLRMAAYPFKSPVGGKSKVFRKSRDEHGNLLDAEERRKPVGKGARPIIVSRQAEILSHFDLRKLMISGGEGNNIKDHICKRLRNEAKMYQDFIPAGFSAKKAKAFWSMMRKQGWGKAYPEPEIEGATTKVSKPKPNLTKGKGKDDGTKPEASKPKPAKGKAKGAKTKATKSPKSSTK